MKRFFGDFVTGMVNKYIKHRYGDLDNVLKNLFYTFAS